MANRMLSLARLAVDKLWIYITSTAEVRGRIILRTSWLYAEDATKKPMPENYLRGNCSTFIITF
jgi:hypothetical protein